MGGVYTVTVEVDVANTQTTRGFVNLYMGATRNNPRGVFTSDSKGSVSATARLADLAVVKTEIYCATATSSTGGWLTLYRLHA
jgi:hypothetical protein